MAFTHYLPSVPVKSSPIFPKASIFNDPSLSISPQPLNPPSLLPFRLHNHSVFSRLRRIVKAKAQEPEVSVASDAFTQFKHLLLPITDRNPYLSEGTKQAIATTTALAKKYGADITVVVIDEQQKESLPEHETQLSTIRWHISEGGLKDYNLLERLGDGSKPTAIIGDVADELSLDLVVISMEAIHTKHIDANLLAEFIPCLSIVWDGSACLFIMRANYPASVGIYLKDYNLLEPTRIIGDVADELNLDICY